MPPAEDTPDNDAPDVSAEETAQEANISDDEMSANEMAFDEPVADETQTQAPEQQMLGKLLPQPEPQDLNLELQIPEGDSTDVRRPEVQNPEQQNPEVPSAGPGAAVPNLKGPSPAAPSPAVESSATEEKAKKPHYKCEECGYISPRQFNFARHHTKMHTPMRSGDRPNPPCCDVGAGMVTKHELRLHKEKVHGKKYSCDKCGAVFDRPSQRERHMRTHTGEKPYPCPLCGRAFSSRSNMRRHMEKARCARAAAGQGPNAGPSAVPSCSGTQSFHRVEKFSSTAGEDMIMDFSDDEPTADGSETHPADFDMPRSPTEEDTRAATRRGSNAGPSAVPGCSGTQRFHGVEKFSSTAGDFSDDESTDDASETDPAEFDALRAPLEEDSAADTSETDPAKPDVPRPPIQIIADVSQEAEARVFAEADPNVPEGEAAVSSDVHWAASVLMLLRNGGYRGCGEVGPSRYANA